MAYRNARQCHRKLSLLRLSVGLLASWTGACAAEAALAKASFKAGFAERDITPAIGMERPGGYAKTFHTSVHDACKVRAAVFEGGGTRVALVGVDALMLPRAVVLRAREEISRRCGIAPGAIMVGASHTHSGGPTGMVQPGQFDFASKAIQKLAYEESSEADAGYLQTVVTAIVEAVVWADKVKVPALLGVGSGYEDKVSFNRRLRMRNGLTWSHPGVGNPDIIGYAGPIDPEVGVVAAWDLDGALLGTIVNFACHATTAPVVGGISASWIYDMEQTVQGALQAKVPVVFLQGASGDITQVDNLSRYQAPASDYWGRLVGGRVGAEASKVILSMARTAEAKLDYRQTEWKIRRRVPDPEGVRRSLEIVQQGKKSALWTFAKETVLLDALVRHEPQVEVEVQAIQVGSAVFVSNPSEYFAANGLRIKRESSFPRTFPVELANGCTGYVPTEEAFDEHGGGYETRLTSYSNLEVTAGTQIARACIDLTKQMAPDKLPEMPRPSAFKSPWALGAVGPQVK